MTNDTGRSLCIRNKLVFQVWVIITQQKMAIVKSTADPLKKLGFGLSVRSLHQQRGISQHLSRR